MTLISLLQETRGFREPCKRTPFLKMEAYKNLEKVFKTRGFHESCKSSPSFKMEASKKLACKSAPSFKKQEAYGNFAKLPPPSRNKRLPGILQMYPFLQEIRGFQQLHKSTLSFKTISF